MKNQACSNLIAPAIMNCADVELLVKSTVKPERAVEILGSISIASMKGPKIIPPPIPRVPAAHPVKKEAMNRPLLLSAKALDRQFT